MQALESEKTGLVNEKTQLEVQIDEILRQIKERDEEKQGLLNMKLMDHNNTK